MSEKEGRKVFLCKDGFSEYLQQSWAGNKNFFNSWWWKCCSLLRKFQRSWNSYNGDGTLRWKCRTGMLLNYFPNSCPKFYYSISLFLLLSFATPCIYCNSLSSAKNPNDSRKIWNSHVWDLWTNKVVATWRKIFCHTLQSRRWM